MKHLFDVFKHLIESLEEAGVDPVIQDMVTDALEALSESMDSEDIKDD